MERMFSSGFDNPVIPPYIQLYPTLRCNDSCHFCFNRNLSLTDDITVKDFEKMVRIFRGLGIQHVDFLGGEPTLHPDLLQLIEIIKRYRLKATLSSNGSQVNVLDAISKKYAEPTMKVGISINANYLSDKLHDYILKNKPVLKSIYQKKGIYPASCEPYLQVPGIQYYLLYMDTMDKCDLDSSVPFHVFYRKLSQLKDRYRNVDSVYCSGFIPDTENYPVLESVRCPAGTTKLSVLPDGAVYPCYLFFRHKEFELGNLLRDEFISIWQNPLLDYFRNYKKNRCPNTSCMLFRDCHGGCPAISYAFHKDLFAPDPRCNGPETVCSTFPC